MTALAVYELLPEDERPEIERRVLARVGAAHWDEAPKDASDALTLADALGGDDQHPALREELRAWWLERATTEELLARIDDADERACELAIVLCAEACAHLTDDPRVAECRLVRLAWVRDEATDEQRDAAKNAAWAAGKNAARDAARDAAWAVARDSTWAAASDAAWAAARDAASDTAWDAARDAAKNALATPLRTLYPDPCEITARCGLARWDAAVAEAHNALRKAVTR